jgi:hypothetical protein
MKQVIHIEAAWVSKDMGDVSLFLEFTCRNSAYMEKREIGKKKFSALRNDLLENKRRLFKNCTISLALAT